MKRLALILLALPAFAVTKQSLTVNSTFAATIPSSAPFTTVASYTIGGRVTNWTTPGGIVNVQSLAGQSCCGHLLRFDASSHFICFDSTPNVNLLIDVTGISDFAFLCSHDVGTNTDTLEVWNVQTGACTSTSGTGSFSGTLDFGGQQMSMGTATARMAFWRWNSGLKAGAACAFGRQPLETDSAANLTDYEYEGVLTDSSGNAVNASATSPAYTTTPTYAPVCIIQAAQAYKMSVAATMSGNCVPNNNVATISYLWTQTTGSWSLTGSTTSSPGITPPSFGTGAFTLIGTDSDMVASSTQSVRNGAVPVDANDIVQLATIDANLPLIFNSGMLRWGSPGYTYLDARHLAQSNANDNRFAATWNTSLGGTITTNGTTTIAGSSTTFKADYCSGGTTWDAVNYFVVWYPLGGGQFGRWSSAVGGCTNDTTIVLSSAYPFSNQGGLNYSRYDQGLWINGSTNPNYYDVCLAHYALYYRTGIDTYLNRADTCADTWWSMPYIDKGNEYAGAFTTGNNLTPRVISPAALFLRASVRGQSGMWPGLRNICSAQNSRLRNQNNMGIYYYINDVREDSFSVAIQALCGLFDPISANRNTDNTNNSFVQNTIWAPVEQGGGNFVALSLSLAGGSVAPTMGNATVVGTGTGWSSGDFPVLNPYFWSCLDPTSGGCLSYQGSNDSTLYTVTTVTDATHIQVSPVYAGSTGSGRFHQNGPTLVGFGTQPFMGGVSMASWAYAASSFSNGPTPVSPAIANGFVTSWYNWQVSTGYYAASNAWYYGRQFLNCEPNPLIDPNCLSAATIDQSRDLGGEIFHGLALAYMLSPSGAKKTFIDTAFNGCFTSPGDGHHCDTLDDTTNPKNCGFFFGWGQVYSWPAARLGSVGSRGPGGGRKAGGGRF